MSRRESKQLDDLPESRKRAVVEDFDEERSKRLKSNKECAQRSRDRRKEYMEEMECKVKTIEPIVNSQNDKLANMMIDKEVLKMSNNALRTQEVAELQHGNQSRYVFQELYSEWQKLYRLRQQQVSNMLGGQGTSGAGTSQDVAAREKAVSELVRYQQYGAGLRQTIEGLYGNAQNRIMASSVAYPQVMRPPHPSHQLLHQAMQQRDAVAPAETEYQTLLAQQQQQYASSSYGMPAPPRPAMPPLPGHVPVYEPPDLGMQPPPPNPQLPATTIIQQPGDASGSGQDVEEGLGFWVKP